MPLAPTIRHKLEFSQSLVLSSLNCKFTIVQSCVVQQDVRFQEQIFVSDGL